MKECPACNRCFADSLNHCPTDGDALRFTISGDPVLDGRYQLERRLGAGGMGAVYKGRHVFLKTTHAIKVILPDLVGNDPSLVTRFRQEAMAAAAIRHQNIISVTDFGVVNETMPFLVMEFLEGCSLHDMLAAEKRLEPARALEIMLAVAAGVGAAHRQGIVHRDLKPLNIMLRGDCAAREGLKVLDFGLAKIKSGDLLGSFVAAKTQGLMGSPFYMAPEQWGDDEPDARSDIYALGVILYQMLAGEVPFRGNTIPSIMNKHLTAAPPALSDKGIQATPEVERAVMRALEKDPEKRPQTIEEFADDLLAALESVGGWQSLGGATNPDMGLRTVPIAEQGASSQRGTRTDGHSQRDLPPGGRTVPDSSGQSAQGPEPARGMETVALPETPLKQTAPPAPDFPQARDTAPEIPGTTAVIIDPGVEPSAPPSPPPPAPTPQAPSELGTGAGEPHTTAYEPAPKHTVPLVAQQQTFHQPAQPHPPAVREQKPPAPAAPDLQPPRPRFAPAPTPTAVPTPAPVPAPPSSSAGAASALAGLPVAVWAAAGVLLLLCVVGGLYVVLLRGDGTGETNTNTGANANAAANTAGTNSNAAPSANTGGGPGATKPELVALPAATFMVGRNDVPPRTSAVSLTYQAWAYNQWPAHAVRIAPFAIDRTEVTNAEYAQFVEKAGYPAPPDWGGQRPPAGQESWPVRNVSLEDAERFAQWRSQRDGTRYRLPTEAEWEYAARGGDAARLYPWGRDWADGRANIDTDSLRPVGSFPEGATPQGAHDMIGNVWEWTSTAAAMYRGNDLLVLAPGDAGKFVVRGGSYQSKASGDEPVTSTARRWVARDRKDPVIGFRLVRPGS